MAEEKTYECEGCGRKYQTFRRASECESTHNCCINKNEKKKGWIEGILYGLVPHTFCILFIIAAIIGTTAVTSFLKPLMMSRYFFYTLIGLSLAFATVSSLFYLKRNNCLCLSGIQKRWRYLSIMYAATIGINIFFFLIIFPAVANLSLPSVTGAVASEGITLSDLPSLTLDVDIPCSGHAPLIIGELKTIPGVVDVKYKSGNFDVVYDTSKTSKEKILSLEVFNEYPAKIIKESKSSSEPALEETSFEGGCGAGCGGSCGGSCGGCGA